MKKIAIVTATRAEYGILSPLIKRCRRETDFETKLVVTGTHLSERYGKTISEIEEDGVAVDAVIPILDEREGAVGVSGTIANALCAFTDYFLQEQIDLLVILGDRTELLGICTAAMNTGVPIAHLHGGELTEGAVDDAVRHAVTKMSYLHFPTTEIYRKRIIQMGEEPERVFQVGALGIENVLKTEKMSKEQLSESVDFDFTKPYVLITYHPVTMGKTPVEQQMKWLFEAMEEKREYQYLITKANADIGGAKINDILEDYAEGKDTVKVVSSLGMKRYLSAVVHSEFVLGNSSSGVIEVPALGVPTVNIGTRQQGRILPDTVVSCGEDTASILAAMEQAEKRKGLSSDQTFGDGKTSERITEIIKKFLAQKEIRQKRFYDV